ncbi:MAG: cory-CC-star protein [Proteobacteria bacterium]|nr:cory-CC-star protein [Pseudomonadota bacterium]
MSDKHSKKSSKQDSLFKKIERGLYEYYVTPYRRSFARAQRDEEDLFMLLVFAESLGLPNPAAYYTMELLPLVYDRFHEWHTRMGMERSPLDHISCC